MFMFSFRLSRRRVVLGVLAVAMIVGLGFAGVQLLTGGDEMASAVPANETAAERVKPQKVTAKNEEERMAFVQSFGWQVAEQPAEVMEVIIPKEFDEVYVGYNAIQKKQGFDLEKYAGKRCKRYTYVITNYPGADCEVKLNLLQYGDKIVGGDICSTELDGFQHGFAPEVKNPSAH